MYRDIPGDTDLGFLMLRLKKTIKLAKAPVESYIKRLCLIFSSDGGAKNINPCPRRAVRLGLYVCRYVTSSSIDRLNFSINSVLSKRYF